MAVLHARGLMRVGDTMTHASPIGSTFDGRIVAETADGIVPAIRGSGFVTGRIEWYVDERDPFPEGYLVNDTWPGDDVQH
jgi:proline racemase